MIRALFALQCVSAIYSWLVCNLYRVMYECVGMVQNPCSSLRTAQQTRIITTPCQLPGGISHFGHFLFSIPPQNTLANTLDDLFIVMDRLSSFTDFFAPFFASTMISALEQQPLTGGNDQVS